MNRLYVFFSHGEYSIYTDIFLLLEEFCVYLKDSKPPVVVVDAGSMDSPDKKSFLLFEPNRASFWAYYDAAKAKVPNLDEYIKVVKAIELIHGGD